MNMCGLGDFATTANLGLVKDGMHYDAQGQEIEAVGMRTVFMRLGPEGQDLSAEFRDTNVHSPSSAWENLSSEASSSRQDLHGCKTSSGSRSATGRREEFAPGGCHSSTNSHRGTACGCKVHAPVASETAAGPDAVDVPNFQTAWVRRGSSPEILHSAAPVDNMRTILRKLQAPVRGTQAQLWDWYLGAGNS